MGARWFASTLVDRSSVPTRHPPSDVLICRGAHRADDQGMFLFLLGLLAGLVEQRSTNVRMAPAAHLEGIMNGILLIALAWHGARRSGRRCMAPCANWAATTLETRQRSNSSACLTDASTCIYFSRFESYGTCRCVQIRGRAPGGLARRVRGAATRCRTNRRTPAAESPTDRRQLACPRGGIAAGAYGDGCKQCKYPRRA